ncbi:MurR/RpiR family transcriptional regulator [Pseudonocardia sp. HH130630-07]|uniref:MurR/RpiR family transcriptional regulator n=1 Tax=Pseudonocardia sp. HH130630-07 TaxID=1690815 RepID=UPI000814C75D|nr:SIS domain-containing protein [Pseudonocardia sp. HH130630-07]ANY09451.1 SIS domain-containing protein [Pseudonocardia sp. HH130630-07]
MTAREPGAADVDRALVSPSQRFDARVQRRSGSVLRRRLVEQELASLTTALHSLTEDGSIERAAGCVVGARRRFVLGTGKSFAFARLLTGDLGASLSQVVQIDGTLTPALDILTDVRDSDVLVAFSLRRYRRETVEIGRAFAAAGGALVLVTDAADAPLTDVATVSLVVPTESASYSDSPTAVASATHLLAALTTASAKGARRRLQERDRMSARLGLYLDPEQEHP